MIFEQLPLSGAVLIHPEKKEDERGFFARVFCKEEFLKENLKADLLQCNISYNRKAKTIRGLHYQEAPKSEVKIVRCTRGKIFDVIVDIRKESSSYLEWLGVELSAENRQLLYVPEGFAHGYQTLTDETEVFYQTTEMYSFEAEKAIRWDDPKISIQWPHPPSVISKKDQSTPYLL